jgi:hypothetical protein
VLADEREGVEPVLTSAKKWGLLPILLFHVIAWIPGGKENSSFTTNHPDEVYLRVFTIEEANTAYPFFSLWL